MDRRIKCGIKAISIIREEIDSELPIQQLALYLTVAEAGEEGITMGEAMSKLKMGQTSVSKNAKTLSHYAVRVSGGELVVKGHGLIDVRPDMLERRRYRMNLTEKGKLLLRKLLDVHIQYFPSITDEVANNLSH